MAKISGIYVEIRGDSSQLKKELREAKDLVTQQAQGMSNALNNALSPAQLKNSLNGLVRDLNTLSNASKLTGKEFAHLGVDLGSLQRITGMTETQFQSLQTKMLQTSAANAQERALRNIAKAANLSAVEVERLGRQMGVSASSIAAVSGVTKSASSALTALSVAGGMIVARLVSEVALLPKAVLDAGIAMDSLQRSLGAISGGKVGAADDLKFLREESERLGQSLYAVAPAYKTLAASARGTSLEGEQTRKIFSAITEASSALGMSSYDTEGAIRAVGQMMSKGKVQAEELRGQLGERLPGAFKLMADALGVTQPQLNKMLEQGQVLAEDALPKLADAIHRMYGEAAQTAALDSAQASVSRLSQAWTDFKVNLFDSDQAVQGINAITSALKTMAEYAGLRSVSDTFAQGSKLANEGKLNWEEFTKASFIDRQKMVDRGGPLNTWRGKVDRSAVAGSRSVSDFIAPSSAPSSAVDSSSPGRRADNSAEKARQKMLEDGKKAAEALDKYWSDYEDGRVKAVADSVAAREQATAKDLQLVTEFADKYKEIVLGETEFKKAQIDAQADAYRSAGADEVAVAQWVAAEKLKVSRDWQDGATRALQSYTDSATNAAANVEDVMTMAFQGIEDVVVEFVKTGKLEFSDLVTSINAEIARLAFRGMAQESYNFLGGLLNMGMSAASSYFGGGTAVSSAAGSAGMAGTMSSLMSRSANGNVFSGPGISAFSNTIVSKPTQFWAKGGNLMGEAGPEAIIPLRRGTDGVLGVKSAGGSDDEMKSLMRELVAASRNQRGTKVVNAIGKGAIANELNGSEGEQVIFNHIRRNPGAVRRMLGL